MSTPINDGGPAFPNVPSDPLYQSWDQGMSLRDWFAGQALAGLVFHNDYGAVSDQDIAKGAYKFADAMLASRKENAQ
jgi:hypothetical protein